MIGPPRRTTIPRRSRCSSWRTPRARARSLRAPGLAAAMALPLRGDSRRRVRSTASPINGESDQRQVRSTANPSDGTPRIVPRNRALDRPTRDIDRSVSRPAVRRRHRPITPPGCPLRGVGRRKAHGPARVQPTRRSQVWATGNARSRAPADEYGST